MNKNSIVFFKSAQFHRNKTYFSSYFGINLCILLCDAVKDDRETFRLPPERGGLCSLWQGGIGKRRSLCRGQRFFLHKIEDGTLFCVQERRRILYIFQRILSGMLDSGDTM